MAKDRHLCRRGSVVTDYFYRFVLPALQAGLVIFVAAGIAGPDGLRADARIGEICVGVAAMLMAFGVIIFADLHGLVGRPAGKNEHRK